MSEPVAPRAARYVAWLARSSLAIITTYVVLLAGALYLVLTQLSVKADFSYLLPPDAPAVRDLRKLEARVQEGDSVLMVLVAPTPEARAAAAQRVVELVRTLPPELVEDVELDDSELRAFVEPRKHMYVPLPDLIAARDALKSRIEGAKLAANPLFIDLDDDEEDAKAKADADKAKLEELREKRREAEDRLKKPSNVSTDGTLTSIQVRTPFRSTDAGKGKRLLAELSAVRAKVVAAHPDVRIGFAGGIVTSVAEHGAILDGMILSSTITAVLVALVLALYFRSATLLVLLLAVLGIATTISFGSAALTVGHLNAATAFLGAIIAGNGVNYGIVLIARYLEERRRKAPVTDALAIAIANTLKPTAIASLGAAIAYGSLAATSFRGFADFAIIGATGMIICWLASYTLLPALMLRFAERTRLRDDADSYVGNVLVKLLGFRRAPVVVGVALAATCAAGVIVYKYIAADPFEYDIKNLRSVGDDAVEARRWMDISDRAIGRGITGRTFIAADRPEQVPMIVAALRARDAGKPPSDQTIGNVTSILDLVPDQQAEKLAVLGEIRALLDDDALEALADHERAELMALRPPDDLATFTAADLPPRLQKRLAEKNGTVGLLISIRPASQLDEWNGKHLIQFARAVRTTKLADNEVVTTSGSSVVFADIIQSIEEDGPFVTGLAGLALIVMCVLLIGFNRRTVAVLTATTAGTLAMVAFCALIDLKVNFLDFVALPITLGLGVDYAINVAHRDDAESDPQHAVRTSGAAVFMCSLTTIIGYGSLLASDNLAIRGFGTASLIGEVACVLCALVLVPAIMALGRK